MPTNINDATAREAERDWLRELHARFLAVAARRVALSVAEDLVQEALVIIVEKGAAAAPRAQVGDEPALAWCFQVLRNVIGNYYQRERTRRRAADPMAQEHQQLQEAGAARPAPTPLEALESAETARLIEGALSELADHSETCGRYLRSILDGEKPARIAQREGLEEGVLYRRVHRCRERLRAILQVRGVLA